MAKRESLLNQRGRQQNAGLAEIPPMSVLITPAKRTYAVHPECNNSTPSPKKKNTKLLRKGDAEAEDTEVEGEAAVAEEVQNRKKRLRRIHDLTQRASRI